jgi:hypothetical protein
MSFTLRSIKARWGKPHRHEWEELWSELQMADNDGEEEAGEAYLAALLGQSHIVLSEQDELRAADLVARDHGGKTIAWEAKRMVRGRLLLDPNMVRAASTYTTPAAPNPPPRIGEFLLAFFVAPEAQEEKLGDMAERFTKTWLPRFGARGARLVYLWHALWLGQRLWRGALFCAAADWFVRKIGL